MANGFVYQQRTGEAAGDLGPREAVVAGLARANTAFDRSDGRQLHGPGIRLELVPLDADRPRQILVDITDPTIAESALARIEAIFPTWERLALGDEPAEVQDREEGGWADDWIEDLQ